METYLKKENITNGTDKNNAAKASSMIVVKAVWLIRLCLVYHNKTSAIAEIILLMAGLHAT